MSRMGECAKLSAMSSSLSRRDFIARTAGAAVALAASPVVVPTRLAAAEERHRLGLDNFAVRGFGWKAPQLVDYAASLGCDALFITDLDAFESLDDAYLQSIRQRADGKGVHVQVGTWSVCPTSKAFKTNRGTADEHLRARHPHGEVPRLAGDSRGPRHLGGPARPTAASIATSRACLACCGGHASQALDTGVKIAIENHAGDMHSTELARLIETAGRDYVGVNLDSGNALWTLEDPIDNLRNLGPYTVTTSLRDSAVWMTPDGAAVAWTAMGEGQIDLKPYFALFDQLCPGVPVHIETISGFNREFPFLKPEFWKAWPHMPAEAFAHFLAIAERGKAREPFHAAAGEDPKQAEQTYERGEIERSIKYRKATLGLGRNE